MPIQPTLKEPGRYARIGKYDIVSYIATGGVCAVYKAVDSELGRAVALKVLPPNLAGQSDTLERFRREARHAARLKHENIVTLFEFGESAGTYFLALEFVDGIDLLAHISERGLLEPDEALPILVQATRALDHLYKFGVVHRDIKPGNFLLTKQQPAGWHVKLTDLGLARLSNDNDFRITKDGFTVGTLDYMSPEQARDSGAVDIRSDIYSLGCTWYHMLAGRAPFGEGGLAERLLKHFEAVPPDIRQFNPRVQPATIAVLARMLAKKPHERYQTPSQLLADLEQLAHSGPAAAANLKTSENRKSSSALNINSPLNAADTLADVSLGQPAAGELAQIGPDQQQAAAGQFVRAKEVIASGNLDYGIHLLLSCCKLDPSNLVYRRVLRRAVKAKLKDKSGSGALTFLATSKSKTWLKAAKTSSDHLSVLQLGEEVLARNPADLGVQLDMAESAEALGATELALWILRHAYDTDSPDLRVVRALARLYEKAGRLKESVTFWELVRKIDPHDLEAARKPTDLSASETIARGEYEKETGR